MDHAESFTRTNSRPFNQKDCQNILHPLAWQCDSMNLKLGCLIRRQALVSQKRGHNVNYLLDSSLDKHQ